MVVCEGKNTEPRYFDKFATEFRNGSVKVEILKGKGTPATIVSRAIKEAQHLTEASKGGRANSFDREFEVWAIFDADNNSDVELKDAKKAAAAAGVKVAFSNPCFEVWILMHYRNVDGALNQRNAQSELSRRMPKYNHSKGAEVDYDAIKSAYPLAVGRGKTSERRRREDGKPEGNPFSGVFKLTEAIKVAAGTIAFTSGR